jgi:hypothetical protein
MARLITLVAVVASLVAFIAEATHNNGSWVYPLDRASYVLAVLAVVAALLSARRASAVALAAQLALIVTVIGFVVVALVKYYSTTSVFGEAISKAYPWANEAQVLGVAALAFGLTIARRHSVVAIAMLLAAVLAAVGSAVYAITLKASYGGELWWWIATVAAFVAASAASTLEREGGAVAVAADDPFMPSGGGAEVSEAPEAPEPSVAEEVAAESDAPVTGSASGEPGSDPVVE